MSPASQGGLQVERYIGTCLISKADAPRYPHHGAHPAAHHGAHHAAHHGAWAGLPLITMVQPRRNKPPPQQQQPQHSPPARSPLSRLAIHTQGAPLILAGRYSNRKNGQQGGQNGQGVGVGVGLGVGLGQQPVGQYPGAHNKGGPRSHRPLAPSPCGPLGAPLVPCGPLPPANKQVVASASSDSLSVASDESSGHSENSLPRIIKPRKRRKKDRKPLQLGQTSATPAGTDGAPTPTPAAAPSPAAPAAVPTVSLKSLGGEAEPADEPKLHHDFDEVKEHEDEAEAVLLCQCRYCDPAGLIWDVDQNCYSPFLTPQPLSSLYISDTAPTASSAARFPDLGHPAVVGTRGASDLLLRRSWSEPTPSRKHSESSDSQDSGRRSPPSRQALEVSSEIVTSHNGHRDIEIKFFSAPTSASELDCRQ